MHAARRWLDGDAGGPHRHPAPPRRGEHRLDSEATPVLEEQLVLHRRMHERSDERMELRRLGRRELENRDLPGATAMALRLDAPRVGQIGAEPFLAVAGERLDTDLRPPTATLGA